MKSKNTQQVIVEIHNHKKKPKSLVYTGKWGIYRFLEPISCVNNPYGERTLTNTFLSTKKLVELTGVYI